ncbi:MAG: rod shape-determining protein MreD [Bacillota bacterium]|nr:rod shape-determining protein MreD [Bacillota bacterium]
MRLLILILLPFLAIFLQSTIFHSYSIKGTVPDLVLVFVVFYAMLSASNRSVGYGFACGLLEDLYMGRMIGINALAKALIGFIIKRFQGVVFKENIWVGIIAVVIGSLVNALILFVLSFTSFTVFHVDSHMFTRVFSQTLYNSLLAAPIYVIYYRIAYSDWMRKNR